MTNIHTLNVAEKPMVHADAIHVLQQALGYETSRDVIDRASYEVADRLAKIEHAVFRGDLEQVALLANSLIAVSTQIGLISVSDIARDLMACAEGGDETAAASIASRLIIHGEESLFFTAEIMSGSTG